MMKGVDFPESNMTLRRPDGTTTEECYDLRICYTTDGTRDLVISCWRGTLMDRLRFLFTGTMWFWAWGHTHPPICLTTERPFMKHTDATFVSEMIRRAGLNGGV